MGYSVLVIFSNGKEHGDHAESLDEALEVVRLAVRVYGKFGSGVRSVTITKGA